MSALMDNSDTIVKLANSPTSNNTNYAFNGKIMLCSVIILFIAVVLLFCFHSYGWRFFIRRRPRQAQVFSLTNTAATHPANVTPHQGLDSSALKALPTFIYNSKTHYPLLECAVCLSEFEDNEKGKVLPKCRHAFHIECIDMWLRSHSNCPLCREPVRADDDVKEIPAETVVSVLERVSSEPELGRKENNSRICCSSFSSSRPRTVTLSRQDCPRNPMELVGIVVEVATAATGDQHRCRGLVDMGLNSMGCHGSKSNSPVNQLQYESERDYIGILYVSAFAYGKGTRIDVGQQT